MGWTAPVGADCRNSGNGVLERILGGGEHRASGGTVPLRWQEAEGRKGHVISVHDIDGKTVIGEFTISGSDSWPKG